MNYGPLIFLGVFLTFASAWLAMVFGTNQQFKDITAQKVEGTTTSLPKPYSGEELQGRAVYVSEGCLYCHSQQIRGGAYQADLERGWGTRRSVPRDYIYDYPQLLGTMRTGPDLTNIGARQPSVEWHHLHLFNPQKVAPGSIMPPFKYLYVTRKIIGQKSAEALKFDDTWTAADGKPAEGYEVVPTDRASALVAYLKSLDRTFEYEPETKPEGGGK